LKDHPYIKFSLANPIVAYRKEHGAFTKVEDIKKIMAVTEEIYKKLLPYVTIQ
jgi:DNA uptake protein ComE-like DNA-binding protein